MSIPKKQIQIDTNIPFKTKEPNHPPEPEKTDSPKLRSNNMLAADPNFDTLAQSHEYLDPRVNVGDKLDDVRNEFDMLFSGNPEA